MTGDGCSCLGSISLNIIYHLHGIPGVPHSLVETQFSSAFREAALIALMGERE